MASSSPQGFQPRKGIVWKRTSFMKSWRPRYFVAPVPGILEYYSPKKTTRKLATISLAEATIQPSPAKEDQFSILAESKVIEVRLMTKEDRDAWVDCLISSKALYLRSISRTEERPINSSSTKLLIVKDHIESVRSHQVKFMAHLKRLKAHSGAAAQNVEGIANDLIAVINQCMDRVELASNDVALKMGTNEDDITSFYSCRTQDPRKQDDEDNTSSSDSQESISPRTPRRPTADVPRDNVNLFSHRTPHKSDTEEKQRSNGYHAEGISTGSISSWSSDWSPIVRHPARTSLPNMKLPKRSNMYEMFKIYIGKDVSNLHVPVSWNEPLGFLQRICEDMEYYPLLEKAANLQNPMERLSYVTAFALSCYACTDKRLNKPFQPFLGETFEYETKNIRFVAEQISTYPHVLAFHMLGNGYTVYGNLEIQSNFAGTSLDIVLVGNVNVRFYDNKHHYTWGKAKTTLRNIMTGRPYISHTGMMRVTNTSTGDYCKCEFFDLQSSRDMGQHSIVASVHDSTGLAHFKLVGDWKTHISSMKLSSQPSELSPRPHSDVIWRANEKPKSNDESFGLTFWGLGLNELSSDLAEVVPPTDTRWRLDIRHMEHGRVEDARIEKDRLHHKLKDEPSDWKPRWFRWRYDKELRFFLWSFENRYWACRESKDWANCPKLFS